MKKFLTTTAAAITLLFAGGYVFSTVAREAQADQTPAAVPHLDPHVGYYEQYLINLGLTQSKR